jgi:large repetitive protein
VTRLLAAAAAAALALAAVGAAAGTTFSAFSGSTSNPANTFAAAASFGGCSAAGTVTAPASIDSWIDQGSSSSNFGSDQILKVRRQGSSKAMRALVRFSLPAVPNGCDVTAATLRLYAGSASANRTLRAYRIDESWTEGGVRWSNQPDTTGTPASATSASGWNQWTVTALVEDMYEEANYGFLVRFDSEGNPAAEMQFHARNKGSQHPELRITLG